MSDLTPKSYSTDPILYLYTSLTSGSSHIVTATSRLETILKANRIPFKALDVATDEKARMLWGRRSGKDESGRGRKLPGLVQMGLVIGDLVEIEEWNEYGELKDHVKIVPVGGTPATSAAPTPSGTPSKPSKPGEGAKPEPSPFSPPADTPKSTTKPKPSSFTLAMRQVGEEAAQKAKDAKKKGMEVLTGRGEAEAPARESDRSATMQSPTSTTWKTKSSAPSRQSTFSHAFMDPMQSPNSTAWKSTDVDKPVMTHRGSSISLASAEEIKAVEDSQTIEEEDEEDEED